MADPECMAACDDAVERSFLLHFENPLIDGAAATGSAGGRTEPNSGKGRTAKASAKGIG
jgi:hypothetical protein